MATTAKTAEWWRWALGLCVPTIVAAGTAAVVSVMTLSTASAVQGVRLEVQADDAKAMKEDIRLIRLILVDVQVKLADLNAKVGKP